LRSRTSFAVVAALAACALSCGGEKAAPPSAETQRHDTVTMNLNTTMSYAPAMIAKANGDFAREGIDLQLVRIDSNSALLAVVAGKADAVVGPIRSGLFNVVASEESIQIVADAGHSASEPCFIEAFTAPPALVEKIRRTGYAGQRFALIKGGMMEYLTDRLLARQDLTSADVELVEIPPGRTLESRDRTIDAVRITFEPALSIQTAEGIAGVIASTDEVAPGHERVVLAFGSRLLHDPDLGRRFMRAWLRGVRRFNEGKTDRNVEIISDYTEFSPDVVRQICWPSIASDGRIAPQAVEPFLEWARGRGYLRVDVPSSKWWNPAFVDAANGDLTGASGDSEQ